MKHYLIFTFLNIASVFAYGQNFTGARSAQLRIVTDQNVYEFTSRDMDGRLNDVLKRFEFIIPFNTMKALHGTNDLQFLRNFANGNETIKINASLPDDKSPELDFSFFKGNKTIALGSEIIMGTLIICDDIDFNGMLMNGDQDIIFNFTVILTERELSFMKVGEEKILEMEITAKGDKISGLTLVK
jgi:hypothetical protein